MKMKSQIILALMAFCFSHVSIAQKSRVVDGPSNMNLYDGANAIQAGDPAEGVRLTLAGLKEAKSAYEFMTAYTNLCAAYVLLGDMKKAIVNCDKAINQNDRNAVALTNRALAHLYSGQLDAAEADLQRGLSINPRGGKLKRVKQLIQDAKYPVEPQIVIEDRKILDRPDG